MTTLKCKETHPACDEAKCYICGKTVCVYHACFISTDDNHRTDPDGGSFVNFCDACKAVVKTEAHHYRMQLALRTYEEETNTPLWEMAPWDHMANPHTEPAQPYSGDSDEFVILFTDGSVYSYEYDECYTTKDEWRKAGSSYNDDAV